jgi:hypothetical protein
MIGCCKGLHYINMDEYKAATAENVGNDLRIGYGSLFV